MSGMDAQRIGAGVRGRIPDLPTRDRINRSDPRLRRQRPRTLPRSPQSAIPAGHLASRREEPRSAMRALSTARPPAPEPAAGVPLAARAPLPEPAAGLPSGARPEAPRRAAKRRVGAIAALVLPVLALLAIYVVPNAGAESAPVAMPANPVGLEGVVEADGGAFTVNGRPWQAVGFNDYRLTAEPGGYVCDGGTGEVSGTELGAALDRARAAGATVVRTWFFQSSWDPDGDGTGSWSAFDLSLIHI